MTFGEECNCGNCTAIGCKQHGFNSQYPEETQHFSQKKGCLSHPRAREMLMADVIEELKSRANRKSANYDPQYYRDEGARDAYEETISLIRGGKE